MSADFKNARPMELIPKFNAQSFCKTIVKYKYHDAMMSIMVTIIDNVWKQYKNFFFCIFTPITPQANANKLDTAKNAQNERTATLIHLCLIWGKKGLHTDNMTNDVKTINSTAMITCNPIFIDMHR